jgi:hypothetical protein
MAMFDLDSSKSFFHLIERRWQHYAARSHKHTEDVLFVILGLNHLREWIAPGYNPIWRNQNPIFKTPESPEQAFSKDLYLNENHRVIRELCNGLKHTELKHTTGSTPGLNFDDWDEVDSVLVFDIGPPSGFTVDGNPIDEIIEAVLEEYRAWFAHP